MLKVVNTATKETLLKTSDKVSLSVVVDDVERVFVTANNQAVSVYLRDFTRDRAEVRVTRSRSGLYCVMEI